MVRLLVSKGVILDQKDVFGKTAVYWAAKKRRFDVVTFLLRSFANPWGNSREVYRFQNQPEHLNRLISLAKIMRIFLEFFPFTERLHKWKIIQSTLKYKAITK